MTVANNYPVIDRQYYPYEKSIIQHFGPFDADEFVEIAASSDGSTGGSFADTQPLRFVPDKDTWIDHAWARCGTKPSVACRARLVAVQDGQTLAQAIAEGTQFLTDWLSLTGLTNNTKADFTMIETNDRKIEVGGTIGVQLDDDPTSLADLVISIRGRETVL